LEALSHQLEAPLEVEARAKWPGFPPPTPLSWSAYFRNSEIALIILDYKGFFLALLFEKLVMMYRSEISLAPVSGDQTVKH